MKRPVYRITRRACGGWTLAVHGAQMHYNSAEEAITSAKIAAKTDRLLGRQPVISVEQDDGTFRTHTPR
jgi:hypothetical protein